jgi:hypothetical protein
MNLDAKGSVWTARVPFGIGMVRQHGTVRQAESSCGAPHGARPARLDPTPLRRARMTRCSKGLLYAVNNNQCMIEPQGSRDGKGCAVMLMPVTRDAPNHALAGKSQ